MLSLIVPVRDWPAERIDYCIDSFLALKSATLNEIVVVDFGSREPLRLRRRGRTPVQVQMLRLEAEVWSLAEAINAGVVAASNEVIAKTDADILIGPECRDAFDGAVRTIEAGTGAIVAQAIDLHESMAPRQAAELVASGERELGRLRAKWGQGGLVFFSRDIWARIGGLESRFTHWGNEDNNFSERVRQAGSPLAWADRERLRIYHMWHPPSHAATGVLTFRQRNQKLAQTDKSVFRQLTFPHSNFARLHAPAILERSIPHVTLAIATSARPHRDRMTLEAIASFRDQIDNDFEIVVVDNGSSEAESAQLRRKLERFKFARGGLRFEAVADGSIPRSRNLITDMARGRYTCVVDDDDIAMPNRLADHLKVFEANGQAHGSHGGWIDFDEETGIIERNGGKQRTIATMLKGTGKITAHPACLYRTDVMRAVRYDESFVLGSDFDLAMRMASLGLEILHTGTYLTLRRFHAANVTVTGQANQVSNGQLARSRTMATFAWNKQAALAEAAKPLDAEAYCRNQLSIDGLARMLPDYVGDWQIYLPISALGAAQRRPIDAVSTLIAANGNGANPLRIAHEEGDDGDGDMTAAPTPVVAPQMDGSLLETVLSLSDGDICTRRSGLNQPIFFRSRPIHGLKRTRRVREAIEDVVQRPAEINSARQGEIDRAIGFEWKRLQVQSGSRIVISERFSNLADLLVCFSRIAEGTLLRNSVSILSDHDERGEAYYLVTPAVHGYEELRTLHFELERRTQAAFHFVAAAGVPSELTLSGRSH